MSVNDHGLEVLKKAGTDIGATPKVDYAVQTVNKRNTFVSTENSSEPPLNNGATYTGAWEDATNYNCVTVAIKTDQAGILYIDSSPDGTNLDSTISFEILASVGESHRITVTRKYFRVRFLNNSGSNQTYLRLQTILGNQPLLSSSFDSVFQQDEDSIVVKSIGDELLISTGLIDGFSIITKFGKNSDVDGPEDINDTGGTYAGFPITAPEELVAVSTSANDAGVLTFTYLASANSTEYLTGTVTLNGLTPVNTGITAYRVHTGFYNRTNSTAFNEGVITLYHITTTTNIFFAIQVGRSQSNTTAYRVPAGYTGQIRRLFVRIVGSNNASIDGGLWTRTNGNSPRLRRPFNALNGVAFEEKPYGGVMIPEKTDVMLRITTTSTSNIDVLGGYEIVLIKN